MAAVLTCGCVFVVAVFGSIAAGYSLGVPALANSGWAGLGALLLAGATWYVYEDRRLKRARQQRD